LHFSSVKAKVIVLSADDVVYAATTTFAAPASFGAPIFAGTFAAPTYF
jgi:hypothetical protein